jgi:uncharacterized protein (TIGR02466 family)
MIEHLYATPVYNSVVKDYKTINYHIDKVIDRVDFNMKDEWGSTHYLSTDFSKKKCIVKELGLRKVTKEIDNHLREYVNEMNADKRFFQTFEIKDYRLESWFSKFKKGNYAHLHHHGDADISGVYYYKTNNNDGDLFFVSPNPHLDTRKCYMRFGEAWEHHPAEGKIMLFPGWLRHGVRTNNTDDTRISLSFNVYFKHER